jgi:2-polyprenyl-3-methyl-5-hydroxy-6-metoxy-1,4-benzoquinol methylase
MKEKFYLCRNYSYRDSNDRVAVLKDKILSENSETKTYLDIGSQFGYFVFKMAEEGYFTMGIECNKLFYNYSYSLVKINNLSNVSIVNDCINDKSIKNIPNFEYISILNVFHHLVYFQGFEKADEIMKTIVQKTNKGMFFETGEFEEKNEYWTDCLSFMGENSAEWTENYLNSLGFSKVEVIGKFTNHLNGHERTFYYCKK